MTDSERSRRCRSRFRGASRLALLARLDRIALLLAALLAVELLEFLGADLSGFGFAVIAVAVVGFALFWGRSVVGLLFGENV